MKNLIKNNQKVYMIPKDIQGGLSSAINKIVGSTIEIDIKKDDMKYYNLGDVVEMFKVSTELFKKYFPNIDVVFSIEGCDYIKDTKELKQLYDLGLRSILLVWNNKNKYGSGAKATGGLTEEGKNFIIEAIKLGITIDLSHMNKETFIDTVDLLKDAKKNGLNPKVIVSHSNVADLYSHPRNITENQISTAKVPKKTADCDFVQITKRLKDALQGLPADRKSSCRPCRARLFQKIFFQNNSLQSCIASKGMFKLRADAETFSLADVAAHHPIGRRISALPEQLFIGGHRRMNRVAESGAEPGLNAAPKQVVHNGIKPGEIINARCLFTFDPAGLQPHPFTAGGAEGIVKGRRVIGVAIERFHADTRDGTGDVMTGEGFQRSERTDAELLIQRRRIVVIQIQVI